MPSLTRSMTAGRSLTKGPRRESDAANAPEPGMSITRHPRADKMLPGFGMIPPFIRTVETVTAGAEGTSPHTPETYPSRAPGQVPVADASGLAGLSSIG